MADEHQDKKKTALDMSEWVLVYSDRQAVPQQANGWDCGCFALTFAYVMSEGLPINYISQADMPAFRQRGAVTRMLEVSSQQLHAPQSGGGGRWSCTDHWLVRARP